MTADRVRTLDRPGASDRAIAIGDGRVLAIGSRYAVDRWADRDTRRLDFPGATVLPGLIDPPLHLHAMAAEHAQLACGEFRRVAALLDAVAVHAAELPARAWVRGHGLDDARLDRLPTPAELDVAAGGRPVRLRHRSLHGSVLSTVALRRVGSARGRVGTSGLVVGREETLRRVVGPLPTDVLTRGFSAAARMLGEWGITTVADATPRSRSGLRLIRAAMRAGHLPQRVFAMRSPRAAPWAGEGRLYPGPVKIVLHEEGSALRPRPETLARLVARAAQAGARVAVHCLGAHALVSALEAFARLPVRQRVGRGHRLEHVAECPPPLVREIARLGLTVVTNPAFLWHRGDVYRRESPPAIWPWLYRARTLARASIPLAAASDAPVVPPHPWIGMATARDRRTVGGATVGPGEGLGARAALAAFTTQAADALGAPALGRLRVGGLADLTIVEHDPLRVAPHTLRRQRVLATMIDGTFL